MICARSHSCPLPFSLCHCSLLGRQAERATAALVLPSIRAAPTGLSPAPELGVSWKERWPFPCFPRLPLTLLEQLRSVHRPPRQGYHFLIKTQLLSKCHPGDHNPLWAGPGSTVGPAPMNIYASCALETKLSAVSYQMSASPGGRAWQLTPAGRAGGEQAHTEKTVAFLGVLRGAGAQSWSY